MEQSNTPDDHALLAELQHRVRNMLATMRALVRRSAETSESLDDYVRHLDGRLNAMARLQNAVIRNPSGGLDLALLVADELAVLHVRDGTRAHIEGPALSLHPRAAEPFSLALHELATNALKFGALSQPCGRIAVTWTVAEESSGRTLLFDWRESGIPLPAGEPSHRGFGRTVLEEMLAHDLRARTTLAFGRDGLTCRIAIPLTERVLRVPVSDPSEPLPAA